MGKQTNISGSHFGGLWTKEKLAIIDDYLGFYTNALRNLNVKLVYIDAFAGSGKTFLSGGEEVEGSAIISLRYDFDEYYFLEINPDRVSSLRKLVEERFPEKINRVHIINDDCNNSLKSILSKLSIYQRGVMFLDPYALELDWSVLEVASKTGVLDIWYLFPLNALVRVLAKDKNISDTVSNKIDSILGTHDWETSLYRENPQISMFSDSHYERTEFNELVSFVNKRLESTFAYVSPKSRILRNSKNSPLFILFFIMTNKSQRAINLGSKVVTQIFDKVHSITSRGVEDENNQTEISFI